VPLSAGTPAERGGHPDDNVILASYESETAEKRGKQARDDFRLYAPHLFNLQLDPQSTATADWGVAGRKGSMISRGVGGAITGSPCDLFLIDDPIKDAKDVRSQTFRDDQWEWYMKVVQRRLRKHTCSVTIYTPWHHDDLGQRMIRAAVAGDIAPMKVLRFPALAETQEERDEWAESMGLPLGQPDPIGRPAGEALWPEVHTRESLERWRKADPQGFYALGQGRPSAPGGDFFRREWFERNTVRIDDVPKDCEFVRAWDKAATAGAGDWSVSVLMARSKDGRYFVVNVTRDRLSAYRRDEKILATAGADARRWGSVLTRGDQDPGSAGKDDAAAFRRLLERFWVETSTVSGDKETRARPLSSSAEGGNVYMVVAEWNRPYLDVLEAFPKGKNDDDVDASSSAFNKLAGRDNVLRIAPNPAASWNGRRARAIRTA
jgi:predicted phage terminase large subunit-like protein